MLLKHVKHYQKQVNQLKESQNEKQQYGRRLCIRIEGVKWLEMIHRKIFCKMLNQLLKNPALKYQKLQSTGLIELLKHIIIKNLG